jgi:hypothetical protein
MPLTARAVVGALTATLALSACSAGHRAHWGGSVAARLAGARQTGVTLTSVHPKPIRPTGLIADVPAKAGLPAGFVLGAVARDLGAFDRAIHQHASLRMMFLPMGAPYLSASTIIENAKLGAETVLELQPKSVTLAQIAAGAEDSWLRSTFAPDVVALSRAVTVSFAPEMNGQWYAWGHGRATPATFVQAWQHIHSVVAATAAAPYVSWMWQPSAIHFTTPSPKPYWPGGQYVDEIGLDGYYIFPTDNFTTIFAKSIALIRSLTKKPIIIGETSVGPLTARQSAGIQNLFAGVRRNHLGGLVWFNIPQNRGRYHQDWRLQDHPLALDTFITQLAAAGG